MSGTRSQQGEELDIAESTIKDLNAQLAAERAKRERMEEALVEIRDHWACQYDHPRKNTEMYRGSYGVGVTDGHRAAAIIARAAITGDKTP